LRKPNTLTPYIGFRLPKIREARKGGAPDNRRTLQLKDVLKLRPRPADEVGGGIEVMIESVRSSRVLIATLLLLTASFAWAEEPQVASSEPLGQIAKLTLPPKPTLPTMSLGSIGARSTIIETPAENKTLFRVSSVALYAATAADLGTTWAVLSRNRVEANPMLGQSRIVQGAIAGGSAVALTAVTGLLYRTGHPKIATILNFVVAGEHGFAAWHNNRN
jgi:hypothetical protein